MKEKERAREGTVNTGEGWRHGGTTGIWRKENSGVKENKRMVRYRGDEG